MNSSSPVNNIAIGTLSERSLHAALKEKFADPDDKLEVQIGRYIIDIVKDDLLVEIQTKNFSQIKNKLINLSINHEILLIHPIVLEKSITRIDLYGKTISTRKSPKKGRLEEIFNELIYIANDYLNMNLSLKVPMVTIEEFWRDDGEGSWRRKGWSVVEQELKDIFHTFDFKAKEDYINLLPKSLPEHFTNQDLKKFGKLPVRLAGKMTYSLRKMNMLKVVGNKGRAKLFQVNI